MTSVLFRDKDACMIDLRMHDAASFCRQNCKPPPLQVLQNQLYACMHAHVGHRVGIIIVQCVWSQAVKVNAQGCALEASQRELHL